MNQNELLQRLGQFQTDCSRTIELGKHVSAIVRSSWAESAGFSIFVLDQEGRLKYQNRRFTESFGDATGKRGDEFLPARMRRVAVQTTRSVLTLFQPIRLVYLVPDGDRAQGFETTKVPLFSTDGGIQGLLGLTRQIDAAELANRPDVVDLRSTRLAPTESQSRNMLMKELEAQVSEASTAVDALAPIQREVAMLLANGLANKQVARELGVSLRTVESYRRQIKDKLAVESSAEMFAVLHLYSMCSKLQEPNPADSKYAMPALRETDPPESGK